MGSQEGSRQPVIDRTFAQQAADRLRILQEEIVSGEVAAVLALSADQRQRFDAWSRNKLAALAEQFDVDTTASQKHVSWGMRIASTLGGIAIAAAIVLFFVRYWGYLETWVQVAIVIATPTLALLAAEWMSQRERTHYFTGLLAMVALSAFIMNLVVVGDIFNIVSTERALLAWGSFALVLAYRYSLRFILAVGLLFLVSYLAAAFTSQLGYHWLDFYDRPEHFLLLGLALFAVPLWVRWAAHHTFNPVYRLVGALVLFMALLSLAEWGAASYLPWDTDNIERFYELAGLVLAAGLMWLGIRKSWRGMVNLGASFFVIFLFTRLYHWWWNWMPRYLFFAIIGALAIGIVLVFQKLRRAMLTANGASNLDDKVTA